MSLFGYCGTPAGEAAYDMMVLNDIEQQENDTSDEDIEEEDELYARD